MPANVVMPALELAQETGKVLRWLRTPGDRVRKGEPLVEIETDKVTTEIEAPASGTLGEVTAAEGDVVPVGGTIALIFEEASAPGGAAGAAGAGGPAVLPPPASAARAPAPGGGGPPAAGAPAWPGGTSPRAEAPAGGRGAGDGRSSPEVKASPLARRIAREHDVDLAHVKTASGRIQKADVLAHLASRAPRPGQEVRPGAGGVARLAAASPKARRLAAERGLDVRALRGAGPGGAVLAADIPAAEPSTPAAPLVAPAPAGRAVAPAAPPVGTVWRIMAERMTASWTTAPHFYLVREVGAGRLVSWREQASKRTGARITYTDLLVKLAAEALSLHPAVNASWRDGAIARNDHVSIGLAVAIDEGLIVPVIHRADTLSLGQIAARREDVVSRGQAGTLRPADIQGAGFTISNLGMYGVDAFSAILNPPQAAILAVGRMADRVVAVNGQPAVQPTMVLTLSCDHRAVDGARAAQFLGTLADLVEEPLALLG